MQQPAPYIDEQTGQRLYNVRQTAQMVGAGVSLQTLWRWTKAGVTSFGLELDVREKPLFHEPRGFRHEAKTHREKRLLIPEQKVLALREILKAVGRDRPDPAWTDCERDALRAATRKHRISQPAI